MAGFFGLFNYAKEGPGVAKDAPQKRPFVVFFEILARKFWDLSVAGLLFSLINIPIFTRGLADAGLTFIGRNFAREKHAFIKEDFFESIQKNWKIALPIGIINTLVTGVLFYNIYVYGSSLFAETTPVFNWLDYTIIAVTLMGFVTFTWMKYYIPFLMITFKLNMKQIYKNAFLFACSNLPVNLLISVVLIAIYALLGGLVLITANETLNILTVAVVLLLLVSVVPGIRTLLIQFCIFPAIKRLIIDPYYKANPGADKQARLDLNLEVEDVPTDDATPAAPVEEPVFVDVVPEKEPAKPKKALPKQYNEKELRHFNRQVQNRNTTDDDDDTI